MDPEPRLADTRPVTGPRRRADWLADEVAELGRRALPREQYYREFAQRLRPVVDADALCWHTLDPETLLMTGDTPEELIDSGIFTAETGAAAGALVVESEYAGDGVNAFAALARRRVPVGILREVR